MSQKEPLEKRVLKAQKAIEDADALVIGAGAGLSAAAGLEFGGERFRRHMSEFGEKYGYSDMYSGDFYPYDTLEEYWAFEAKSVLVNRYAAEALPLYRKLYSAVRGRRYFVITTNVDGQFVKAGFPPEKVFATQGDYCFFQCSRGCHDKLYYNENAIRTMVEETRDCKIPSRLLPVCPVCGAPMAENLRVDQYFVEDREWHLADRRFEQFVSQNGHKKIVYLEFGVGYNTPGIIRFPFERWTSENPDARLIRFNRDYPEGDGENKEKTVAFTEDMQEVMELLFWEKLFPDGEEGIWKK